jgi:predicted flap endonuclease-1-like 5' DNA nuclease
LQLVDAFRGGGWGVGILGGLSILLGILLIARPVIAGLTLPWVLGGLLIFGGILAFVAAFALRNMERELKESQAQAARVSAAAPIPVTGSAVAQAPTVESRGEAAGAMSAPGSAAGAAVLGAASVAAAGMPAAEESEESISQMPGIGDESAAGTVLSAGVAMQEPAEEVLKPASSSIDESVQAAESLGAGISEAALTGNVTPADPEEMAKFSYLLEYVEGIGPVYAERLKLIGLANCLDLLKVGASRKGREEIAINSGISSTLILKWVNHIDLYRIKGVGSEYADLLEASGVDTVVEMAQRNPANLYEKMIAVNTEKALVRKLPTAAQVEDWVSQAKGLPRVITY